MIAYLILVHRFPKQFKRLFKAIYDPENYYLIHIDKKSGSRLQTEISEFIADYANTAILPSQNTLWGGYSLIDVELRGIRHLLEMGKNWEFFINLSGQDFPLKTPAQIKAFLALNKDKNFLEVVNQTLGRFETLNRIQNYVLEVGNKVMRTPFKRAFLPDVTPYIGNQWLILTRKFCEFVTYNQEVDRFKKFYRHTFIPDESFFQTVIMNTSYKGEIVSDDKRAIDWVPSGPIKLRPRNFTSKDAPFLLSSENLFARKFNEKVDTEIFNILESHLALAA